MNDFEVIFTTKNDRIAVKSVYLKKENCFAIVKFSNGKCEILEKVNNIKYLLEFHEFWVNNLGLLSTSFSVSQVGRHLTYAS